MKWNKKRNKKDLIFIGLSLVSLAAHACLMTKMPDTVPTNWSYDGTINASDKAVYLKAVGAKAGTASYDVGVDIDRNGTVNSSDKLIYLKFVGAKSNTITYADVTVK